MAGDRYLFHHRGEVDVDAGAHNLFAHLDDCRRLAGHMEKRSLMMASATMNGESSAAFRPRRSIWWNIFPRPAPDEMNCQTHRS